MDEEKKIASSKKSPFRALSQIDRFLNAEYQAPVNYKFSENNDIAIIQKALLYHKIRGHSSLRTREKNAINDAAYDLLARDIIEGRDPVMAFIEKKSPQEQVELLGELMRSDRNKAWFESMLTFSAEKKAEAASVGKQSSLSERLGAASSKAQSEVFAGLADNREESPKAFLANPLNYAAARRILAVQLHRSRVERETEEFKKAIELETPERQSELLNNRPRFPFEESAIKDMEAYLKQLETSPEITAQLYRMTRLNSINELSKALKNPPKLTPLNLHDNLSLMEDELVPNAVNAFLASPDGPKDDTALYKLLKDLAKAKEHLFPVKPTPEDCDKRIREYEETLKELDKSNPADSAEIGKLKKIISDQIELLKDTALAPDREKIQVTFRADTLIDYFDSSDPEHKPMDALEAREKLIRGATLEQKTFADGEFVGTGRTVSYDKKTGLIVKGPEKVITRVIDLSDAVGKKPELQLEELRKIKDVLKSSDPFYVKNSESYTAVMNSLNKVIKAQESMDKESNLRQVAVLRALYSELDTNVGKYIKDKGERMKTGDERGELRMDVMKTLKSITGDKHVKNVSHRLFDEQKKFDTQQKIAKPCMEIINKWKKAGTPSTPAQYAEFRKDFKALSSRFDMVKKSLDDLSYYKMNIAEDLGDYTRQAEEVQKKLGSDEKLNESSLLGMKGLAAEGGEIAKKHNEAVGSSPEKPKEKSEEQQKTGKVINPLSK